MIKTFKNLLQNRIDALGLNLCIYHWGWEIYQSCENDGPTLTFDLFTARSSLLPYSFVWAPYICMGNMLRISNNFSSEASGLKFQVEPPWGRGTIDCRSPFTKMSVMPIYGKNL